MTIKKTNIIKIEGFDILKKIQTILDSLGELRIIKHYIPIIDEGNVRIGYAMTLDPYNTIEIKIFPAAGDIWIVKYSLDTKMHESRRRTMYQGKYPTISAGKPGKEIQEIDWMFITNLIVNWQYCGG